MSDFKEIVTNFRREDVVDERGRRVFKTCDACDGTGNVPSFLNSPDSSEPYFDCIECLGSGCTPYVTQWGSAADGGLIAERDSTHARNVLAAMQLCEQLPVEGFRHWPEDDYVREILAAPSRVRQLPYGASVTVVGAQEVPATQPALAWGAPLPEQPIKPVKRG